jgi:hypothetical protein
MCVPNVQGSAVVCGIGYRKIWFERLMAPYVFSFMIDAASLLLGMALGAVGALAVILVIKNF